MIVCCMCMCICLPTCLAACMLLHLGQAAHTRVHLCRSLLQCTQLPQTPAMLRSHRHSLAVGLVTLSAGDRLAPMLLYAGLAT